MSTSDDSLKETGRCAAAALVGMVAALECDYDRLEELRTRRDNMLDAEWLHDGQHDAEREELAELEAAAGECTSRDDAEQCIQADALSVQVRSGWLNAADNGFDEFKAEEFEILLSTGGPAARIRGELDEHGQPDRAWLEVQDWGTPWTQHFDIKQDTLLAYARCFYFGEG